MQNIDLRRARSAHSLHNGVRPAPIRMTAIAGLVMAVLGASSLNAAATADQHDSSRLVSPGSKMPDHEEFEATLKVPYVATSGGAARDLELRFEYPAPAYSSLSPGS